MGMLEELPRRKITGTRRSLVGRYSPALNTAVSIRKGEGFDVEAARLDVRPIPQSGQDAKSFSALQMLFVQHRVNMSLPNDKQHATVHRHTNALPIPQENAL